MTRLLLTLFLTGIALFQASAQIRIHLTESSGIDRLGEPVTLGVPFAKGQIKEMTGLGIRNPEGGIEDAQFSVMSRWQDGSSFQSFFHHGKVALTLPAGLGAVGRIFW